MQLEQSFGQVCGVSPHSGSHIQLPQAQVVEQSCEQETMVSPHAASHTPSPHSQSGGQSSGQLCEVSLHCGRHCPSPQMHSKQSTGQLWGVSPQLASQNRLPQTQACAQSVGHEITFSPHSG
jgi:hypothetical protein